MGFSLGGAVNGAAEWACSSPLVGGVVSNGVFAALLVTALIVLALMGIYREEARAGGRRKGVRAVLGILLIVSGVMFVHHYAVSRAFAARADREGLRDAFEGIQAARALGGGARVVPDISAEYRRGSGELLLAEPPGGPGLGPGDGDEGLFGPGSGPGPGLGPPRGAAEAGWGDGGRGDGGRDGGPRGRAWAEAGPGGAGPPLPPRASLGGPGGGSGPGPAAGFGPGPAGFGPNPASGFGGPGGGFGPNPAAGVGPGAGPADAPGRRDNIGRLPREW